MRLSFDDDTRERSFIRAPVFDRASAGCGKSAACSDHVARFRRLTGGRGRGAYMILLEREIRFPLVDAPEWGANVERWYQLDGAAAALADLYWREREALSAAR